MKISSILKGMGRGPSHCLMIDIRGLLNYFPCYQVVRALLQHDNSSLNYCYLFENYRSIESLSKDFREVLNRLLKGCNKDDNTLGNVDGVIYRKHADIVIANRSVDNEYTVATIMVLASGHHWFPTKKEKGKKYVDSLAVLQTLQRIPKNNIQSVEVLWSPQREDEVLFEETIRRYTTMTRVNNGQDFSKDGPELNPFALIGSGETPLETVIFLLTLPLQTPQKQFVPKAAAGAL
ncbi:hypothetical protein POM88_005119 [Heracleum sosnowskyi]|uniref:Uncharacterized protein n=1 Tax=Heracleum sosnowskyi TaxID=360622 RepID=A0AAD8ND68_9APIA|nr:hypothetical protein POM88_005119 [Heracleum sosnowskyi]